MQAVTGQSIAYFCSRCGSASVEYSQLSGGNASCNACGWEGKTEQLMQHAFKQEQGSNEEMLRQMMNDIRKVYAGSAADLAVFLHKWGFISAMNPKEVTRYVAAIGSSTLQAVLRVRQEIEKERIHGGS